MKSKKNFSIYLVCMIIWMGVIFSFSAQPAEESTNTSVGFGMKLADVLLKDFKKLSNIERQQLVEDYDFWIRKSAHFCEYAVLGIWCALMLAQMKWEQGRKVLNGVAICAMSAVGDEFHQLFVSGRAGRWQDVCIDTAGAFTGIMIVMIWMWCLKKNNKERILWSGNWY